EASRHQVQGPRSRDALPKIARWCSETTLLYTSMTPIWLWIWVPGPGSGVVLLTKVVNDIQMAPVQGQAPWYSGAHRLVESSYVGRRSPRCGRLCHFEVVPTSQMMRAHLMATDVGAKKPPDCASRFIFVVG